MTPHREWFDSYEEIDGGRTFLRYDKAYTIVGKGYIPLRYRDRRIRYFLYVGPIPRLKRYLLAMIQLNDARVDVIFKMNMCNLVRVVMILDKGNNVDTLYRLESCYYSY